MKNKYYALTTEGREADIYIFGDITSWLWEVNDMSSWLLAKAIEDLNVDVINVYINSYGGEVAEGLAIHNALMAHGATIKTYCSGFACSAASIVYMAGAERYMYPASLLFIHNAWQWAAGNAEELHKTADDLAKISDVAANTYRAKVNITDEQLQEMLDAETWLTPQEALEMGFATAIISEPATMKASANARKKMFAAVFAAQAAPAPVAPPVNTETPPEPELPEEPPQDPPQDASPTPELPEEPTPPKQSLSGYIYALLEGKRKDDK